MPVINNEDYKKLIKSVLFGTVAAVCITVIVLFLAAIIITVAGVSSRFASPISSVALAIGSILGGRFSASKNGKKGLLCGLLTGLAIFLIITVTGMFLNNNFSLMTLIHFVVIFLASGIGGILGVNKSQKRKIV